MSRHTLVTVSDTPVCHRATGTIEPVREGVVQTDELQAAIEPRNELGPDVEPAVIDAFVERIERRLAQRAGEGDRALKEKREHQKELVLGPMKLSIRSS